MRETGVRFPNMELFLIFFAFSLTNLGISREQIDIQPTEKGLFSVKAVSTQLCPSSALQC